MNLQRFVEERIALLLAALREPSEGELQVIAMSVAWLSAGQEVAR